MAGSLWAIDTTACESAEPENVVSGKRAGAGNDGDGREAECQLLARVGRNRTCSFREARGQKRPFVRTLLIFNDQSVPNKTARALDKILIPSPTFRDVRLRLHRQSFPGSLVQSIDPESLYLQ